MPDERSIEERLREEATERAKRDNPDCEHRPMKAALDDRIGCKMCGAWLGRAH